MCLSACFVLPIEDSMESIFNTVKNAALVHKEGGGTGFDSDACDRPELRPPHPGARLWAGVLPQGHRRGHRAVKQGGTRRGANMGILRADQPRTSRTSSS